MAHVEIILLERISSQHHVGDVVKVRAGYARNYLIPQGKALRATQANRKIFEERKEELFLASKDQEAHAMALRDRMKLLRLSMGRQASENGQLYGSVTARDLVEQLQKNGFQLNHNQVQLSTPIKTLGSYSVALTLHAAVSCTIHVDVVHGKDGDSTVIIDEEQSAKSDANETSEAPNGEIPKDEASKDEIPES